MAVSKLQETITLIAGNRADWIDRKSLQAEVILPMPQY